MSEFSQEEIRAAAARIIAEHNEDYEFCLVYEDPDLEDCDEETWLAVHAAMNSARVVATWPAPSPSEPR